MPETSELELRATTLDDAEKVSDLESALDPEEPSDPSRRRHWWRMTDTLEKGVRRVAERDGAAIAYTSASHELWSADEKRYGTIRLLLAADEWTEGRYAALVRNGEEWLRREGAAVAVIRLRADRRNELSAVHNLGYRENRRMRMSELDLVANRDRILATRDECRRRMSAEGVTLHPLSKIADGDRYQRLYTMVIESEKDIPTTVPWRELSLEEWMSFWFDCPNIREDWFWVAREGDDVVGTSVLDVPVVRGLPWTAYTGTSRAVRGRGIARALKYESIGQAVEAGYPRVRTNNDADNPAILRINAEMGYHLIAPIIELHRDL